MPVTPDKWLTEFSASTNNNDMQLRSATAALKDGGFVVVWNDSSQVGGDNSVSGIKLQRFDAVGSKVGAETLVNTVTVQDQGGPDVTVLSDGSYIVAYGDGSQTAPDTSSYAIRARHFAADGTPIGNEFVVNTTTTGAQLFPNVTALSNGGYAIAWQDASQTGADTSGLAIRYQRFDANDAKVGAEFLVNTTTTGSQFRPDMITLDGGTYVIAWEDQGSGHVRARHYNANGVDLGGDFVINTTLSGQSDVHLAALSNGGFVATWSDGTTLNIKSQLFNQNHAKIGGEFTINTTTAGTQDFSAVTALKSGGFFVVWRDFNGTSADTDEGAIRGQLFDNNGSKIGSEILVNTVTAGDQFNPHVSELAGGRLLVSWGKESPVTPIDNAIGISAQILDPRSGAITGTAGNDVLVDYASGDNSIFGLGGDDILYGVSGSDTLDGGANNDTINGNAGSDLLIGGTGSDHFVFDATARTDAAKHIIDTVSDYTAGDQIDLSALLGPAFGAGQGVNALVRVIASGSDANLQIDTDGTANGAKWLTIAHLDGVHAGDAVNVILGSASPAGSNASVMASDLPASSPKFSLAEFGAANFGGGWASQDQFPRVLGDVNGDGMDDIIGFGYAGASVALATGAGNFATAIAGIYEFGAASFGGGWTTQNQFPRLLGDVNGDGMDDIVGFGNAGASVALATGGGNFATAIVGIYEFGAANFGGGWASQDQFPRMLGDVNGDGMDDIVGFGYAGVTVALATGGGHFAAGSLKLAEFGAANFGGGWASQDQFPRAVADVNGDGMADIIGFGNAGVTVALATGGGNFAPGVLKLAEFGAANFGGGWSTQDQFPRFVEDVNGDGMADIVGFGNAGASVALATGGGAFGAGALAVDEFGATNSAGGWSSQNLFPRELGDVNGDGTADIVGFGYAGVTVSQLHGFLL